MIRLFSQWRDIDKACKESGLIPAEIRSEEENEAATKLDKRIDAAFDGHDPVLLGATDGRYVDMEWYWMSQIEPKGSPIYKEGKVVGNAFHKFIWNRTSGAPDTWYDCIHMQDGQNGVFWEPVKCESKDVMCEARLISGVSFHFGLNPSIQALGDL